MKYMKESHQLSKKLYVEWRNNYVVVNYKIRIIRNNGL